MIRVLIVHVICKQVRQRWAKPQVIFYLQASLSFKPGITRPTLSSALYFFEP